jgi:hypothetical protein
MSKFEVEFFGIQICLVTEWYVKDAGIAVDIALREANLVQFG